MISIRGAVIAVVMCAAAGRLAAQQGQPPAPAKPDSPAITGQLAIALGGRSRRRRSRAATARRRLHQRPVRRRDVDLRSELLLEVRRATKVIGVSVRDQNRLHLRRIEAKLHESWEEIRLDLIRAQRVDHHQTRRRLDHVGDRADVADRVHVVEELRWLNDRIVRAIGARRLTPEVHGIGPPRANRLLEPIELLHDGRRVRLGRCLRLILPCVQREGRSAHQHDDEIASSPGHRRVLAYLRGRVR